MFFGVYKTLVARFIGNVVYLRFHVLCQVATLLPEIVLSIINGDVIPNNICRQDNRRECDLQLRYCPSGSFKRQAYSPKPCMFRFFKNPLKLFVCIVILHDVKYAMSQGYESCE
jgi:hypothetical protein